jgi:hypothetical protein
LDGYSDDASLGPPMGPVPPGHEFMVREASTWYSMNSDLEEEEEDEDEDEREEEEEEEEGTLPPLPIQGVYPAAVAAIVTRLAGTA